MKLCVVTQRQDVIDHPQAHGRLNLVGAVMTVFRSHAGRRLCLFEVLLQRQTDRVGILDVLFPVLVDEPDVVVGETNVEEAHLHGFVTNQLGDIGARGLSGRLQVAGPVHAGVELFHHGLVLVVVFLHGRCADAGRPFGIGAMLDLLANQRIFSAVKIDVFANHWDARNSFQLLRYGYFNRVHSSFPTGADHYVAYFQHRLTPFQPELGRIWDFDPRGA